MLAGFFESAVFGQTLHNITLILLEGFLLFFRREQRAGFDEQQSSRHLKELARRVHIYILRLSDYFEVLLCDFGYEYLRYIYLCLAYQMQEQIERSFEA